MSTKPVVAVDLDGVLAEYDPATFNPEAIGKPIPDRAVAYIPHRPTGFGPALLACKMLCERVLPAEAEEH